MLDPLTLQAQLVALQQDATRLQEAANAKLAQVHDLNNQIEQHRGALSYIASLTDAIQKQIIAIKAAEVAPP
jgi:uncharacterized protein YlxW (UPF0749 family)